MQKVEQAAWSEVAPFLLDPGNVKRAAAALIEKWQDQHDRHSKDIDRLESLLARLKEERTWVITQGRKGVLSDDDMAEQLAMVKDQQRDARRELADARRAMEAGKGLLSMVDQLAVFLEEYEGELQTLAETSLKDMTKEQRKAVQKWFDAVVERVELVDPETRELRIETNPFGILTVVSSQSTLRSST
jgi:hypothetical protein